MPHSKARDIAEAEDIGKSLKQRTQAASAIPAEAVKPSHDAADYVWAEYLQNMQPDLVLPKYFDAFIRNKKGDRGWTTMVEVGAQKSINATKQTVHVQFKRISEAIAKAKAAREEPATSEFLTAVRVAEILRRGKPVQLDPYALLTDNPESRYFQRRRIRLEHSIEDMAESVGKVNILEMPTVQAPCTENGMIHRLGDGFGRIMAWMMADEKAGGTRENPVLEYPVCFVIECTNREMALVALEKNRHKENFDDADRDYSIVLMNEREHYSVTELANIQGLDKSTVSLILSAWQDVPRELRAALETRKVTTYHGRQIARLKKWPKEQDRLAKWLMEQVEQAKWPDAHLEPRYVYPGSKTIPTDYDENGVSAGQLGMMVNSALERLQNAEKAAAKLQELKEKGTVSDRIDEEKAEKLRSKLAKELGKTELSKTSMQMALREAGIKLERPKSDEYQEGPKRPASPANYREREPEKPIPPCMNCTLYYPEQCEWSLEPDAENKCPVQKAFMGPPTKQLHICSICGGPTPDSYMNFNKIAVHDQYDTGDTIDHNACVIDKYINEGRLSGKCAECQSDNCGVIQLLDDTVSMNLDGPCLQVVKCPVHRDWFEKRPAITITELNAKVQAEIDGLKLRIMNNASIPGRSLEDVRAEFLKELTLHDYVYTLAGIYESEAESDKRVEEAYANSEDHHVEVRGGYGDPKLWGVYVRPLEEAEDDAEAESAEEYDPEGDFEGETEHHDVAGEDA